MTSRDGPNKMELPKVLQSEQMKSLLRSQVWLLICGKTLEASDLHVSTHRTRTDAIQALPKRRWEALLPRLKLGRDGQADLYSFG